LLRILYMKKINGRFMLTGMIFYEEAINSDSL